MRATYSLVRLLLSLSPFHTLVEAKPVTRKRSIPTTHTVHERQGPHVSKRWEAIERADPDVRLPMRIGLRQSNLDNADDLLDDVSNPNSPNYGKYLSSPEVIDLFAPSDTSISAVTDWLVSTGLVAAGDIEQSANKQWLAFSSRVSDAEDILLTQYHVYEHRTTGIRNVGCEEYHVPRNVSDHVDYITPGIKLMSHGYEESVMKEAKQEQLRRRGLEDEAELERRTTDVWTSDGLARLAMVVPNDEVRYQATPPRVVPVFGCDMYSTVECTRDQYQIPLNKYNSTTTLGIYQGLAQHYSQEDLDLFFWNMYPSIPNGTHPTPNLVNGAFAASPEQSRAGSEANLDFQIAYPLIWPSNPVLWQIDDEVYELNQTDPNTPYKGFFNNLWNAMDGSYCESSAFGQTGNCVEDDCRDPFYPNPHPDGWKGELMCGVYEPTSIISMSYAGAEVDLPPSYHRRQCLEVLKLGLQGTTVVVSSGDDGVASFPGDPYPNGCLGDEGTVFNPMFLASCPYVTAVGGTEVIQDRTDDGSISDDNGGTLMPLPGDSDDPDEVPEFEDEFTFTPLPLVPAGTIYTETATSRFKSGGGFSNLFPRPEWQAGAVSRYLCRAKLPFPGYYGSNYNYSSITSLTSLAASTFDDLADPVPLTAEMIGGHYNRLGRAYPDVAAIGDNVPIWHRGRFVRFGGTSVSAPLFASLLHLVNEERVAVGKGTVGFVNPVLYANPEAFKDITIGDNANCGTSGFPALKGWDPVTGLGTPIYPKLLEVFMNLP